MEKCLYCGRIGVTYTPESEELGELKIFLKPHEVAWTAGKIIKSGLSSFFDSDYEKNHAQGDVLKCKFCKAYHVECYNCLKISLVAHRPKFFDQVICPHCSKIMEIGNTDLSGDSEIYRRPFGYHK